MLGFALLISCLVAQAAPDDATVKGLAFLEKNGMAWTEKNKCASCHHVPMMLWSQQEARRHGLPINEDVRRSAKAFALNAPPTGFWGPLTPEKLATIPGANLEIIYISLAVGLAGEGEGVNAKVVEMKSHLLDKQEPDGSWIFTRKEKGKLLAPIQDSDEVVTLLALLALSPDRAPAATPGPLKNSRDKSLAWLTDASLQSSSQSRALGLVALKRFGVYDRVGRLRADLLGKQRGDGGCSQGEEQPSDALATGQALFALAAAGVEGQHETIRRARAFLAHTQREDGSWLVPSRVPQNKGKDEIPTYFGSAWAVIGLVQYCDKK